jgi:hypothetical protein
MGLCSKMDDMRDFLRFQNVFDEAAVIDVGVNELVVRSNLNFFGNIAERGTVIHGVNIDEAVRWVLFDNVVHEVRTDEAATAGNQDVH